MFRNIRKHSWTMRQEDTRLLQAICNKLMRMIGGWRRRPNEDWVRWVQRTTRKARIMSDKAGVQGWVKQQAVRKWNWAGHVARRPENTWVKRVTSWRNSFWEDLVASGGGGWRPRRARLGRWLR